MPWLQTGGTQYHAQLGLPDKGRAIKGFVVCNNWDLEHFDLLNGLPLGCYEPSPAEVLIGLWTIHFKTPKVYKLNKKKIRNKDDNIHKNGFNNPGRLDFDTNNRRPER